MKTMEVTETTPLRIRRLAEIWETPVRSTHLFLTDDEIERIQKYVP